MITAVQITPEPASGGLWPPGHPERSEGSALLFSIDKQQILRCAQNDKLRKSQIAVLESYRRHIAAGKHPWVE